MFDVVVVGGSLAGSATAIHLARRGRSVLLLDRASFPRRKSCGEGLFPRGVHELEDLGVLPAVEGFSAPVTSLRFTMDGRSAEAPVGRNGRRALGVQRLRLDELVLQRAQDEGVDVRPGVEARTLIHTKGRYSLQLADASDARIIVAADGLRSGLRRQAGLDAHSTARRYGVSAHFRTREPAPPRVEVHYARGYEVYITPVGERLLNIAVLMGRKQSQALAGRLEDGYVSMVGDAVGDDGRLELADEPLAAGPFPASAKAAWRDNLVLVGDAAGFFDGITGDGMTLALLSARRCAAAIDAVLESGAQEPLRAYDAYRRRLARNSTWLARLNLFLASRPVLGRMSINNLARHPETFRRLMGVNNGDLELKDLRPRDILALAVGL